MSRPHNNQRQCAHCGANTLEHRHSLTAGLVSALVKLARAGGGPINLKKVGLSREEWDNFQKLKHWGLVLNDSPGVWYITLSGHEFLAGKRHVHKSVWTYRDEVVEYAGPEVTVSDVLGEEPFFLKREDYASAR